MADPAPGFTMEEPTADERTWDSNAAARPPPPTPSGWPEEWCRLAATLEPEEEIVLSGDAPADASGG